MLSKQKDYLEMFIQQYVEKTKKSKLKASKYSTFLADSRRSTGFRIGTKELLYPIIGQQARCSHFWDIDENEYIDISMGFGALLFGHMPGFLRKALEENIHLGIQLGPQANLAAEVAQLICELAGVDRVAFCNTGTEAVMTALRLARLKTGRQKIILFDGSYHGFYDATLAMPQLDKLISMPIVDGLPIKIFEDIYVLPYLEEKIFNLLSQVGNQVAAIIVEPVRGRFPSLYSQEFLIKLRKMASHYGIVLIFDEIVTGFRCHLGGAQAYFNIKADLVTYGKALAGGLPIGIVGGNDDILGGIDGGSWKYEDKSFPLFEKTFFAGTFNKNPLTIVAAHAILNELKRRGPELQEELNKKTKLLAGDLNDFFLKYALPIHISFFSSLFRIEIKQEIDIFFYHLIFKNLYTWEGRSFYLSTEHQQADLNNIGLIIKETALLLNEQGFIGKF